ncbi:DUF1740-domain-containing protein [Ophiobolus disseminans]|uniref:DUF1740-domain-containing protein n=1 Tax=Ophiobolus disseminans TaxID=1469910 RepID=A0A6A7A538_9PLEO|nr:DUF1740-domain-containing protein [Ophiobolus disseminans]
MASNIPKFASFRPKPKPGPEPPKEHQTPPRPAREEPKEHKRSKRTKSPPPKKLEVETDTASSKLYFSDRRGDADVLQYGALNRYDVPAYRRFGYGYVLGIDTSQKIDRERSSDTKVYLTPARRPRQERLLIDKRTARESDKTLRFIKPSDKHAQVVDEDFIPVSAHGTAAGDDNSDEAEPPDASYRSIDANPNSQQPIDPDTQYDSNTEATSARAEVTKRNSELVRKTRESPESLKAWQNFIDHQETMMTFELQSAELNDATRLQLSDVRVPIYEEALKKVGANTSHQIELYKGLFKEAQRSWNESKLVTRFKEVLAKHPASTDLWFMYLNLVQSSFTQYESCRAAFVQCLQTAQSHASGIPVEEILHFFIRMTSMIHGAGYQELALAIWQAVLEGHLSGSKEGCEGFEVFWDEEAPRIGEPGARGWQREKYGDTLRPVEILLSRYPSYAGLENFSRREVEAIDKLRYPGRTCDDVDDEDAFHTILYDDVQEYFDFIPAGTPTALVLEAFLCFCGLPPLPTVASHQQAWWNDPFLASGISASSGLPTTPENEFENNFNTKVKQFESCLLPDYQMTSEILSGYKFSLKDIRLSADFIRRVLQQIIASDNNDIIAEYLLAFESQHYPSEVVKTAKQLLKSRPVSQRLYHAYGLVELRWGNSAKAAQVFSMAISLGNTSTLGHESVNLLSSWVWEALSRSEQVEALWRLVSHSGKQPPRPNPKALPSQHTLESTRLILSSTTEQALLAYNYPFAVTCTSLLALLAYLPSSNAPAFLTTHKNLSNYFTSHALTRSPAAQLLAQSTVRLLHFHITHAPIVQPALARTALEPLISTFPSNTLLLALYAANEARFAIDDRVRGIMAQNVLTKEGERGVAAWSFAIHFEGMRNEISGSTAHSVRALYKRATHGDAVGAHCPALWASYLRFELSQLHLQRNVTAHRTRGKDGVKRGWQVRVDEAQARVKETFFSGLRMLPWCKDFGMLAFTQLGVVLSKEEAERVYGVMLEKEVRVYVETD